MFSNWNFWLSIITAAVAVLALMLTLVQIRNNNKQHLFDKRIENYLVIEGLIQLYISNKNHLDKNIEEPFFAVDLVFGFMTNNSFLEQITCAIDKPLEQPNHKRFLFKMEEMKQIALETKFIFKKGISHILSNFILSYQELLLVMYQYQIIMNRIDEANKEKPRPFEELAKKFNENSYRDNLKNSICKLKQSYEILEKENVVKKIAKQIKL